MNLTEQQKDIVNYEGDLIVSAVAGSGKSTTVLHHASKRPDKKKLILFFNKSMADEMTKKAKVLGIKNIDISTSHSLAFRRMGIGGKYEVGNIMPYELLKLIPKMKYTRETMAICYAATQYLTKWCQSDAMQLEDIAKHFFSEIPYSLYEKPNQNRVVDIVKLIEKFIDEKKLPMPHALYLKRFQLQKVKMDYDYVYIDEFQDTAPVVFDIFKNQDHSTRICIGDSSQSINSWNGAIDAMEKVDFPLKELNVSFRFGKEIADRANEALMLKNLLGPKYSKKITQVTGAGGNHPNGLKATLARTNGQILNQAIEDVFEGGYEKVYFESGFDSYINSGGYSVYDILNLKQNDKDSIKSDFIAHFEDFVDLKSYVDETQDVELGRLVKLVDKHGRSLLKYIPEIRGKQVDKSQAKIIYSTAHKSKGQEYGTVRLLDGFITAEDIQQEMKKILVDKDQKLDELEQNINLLYVSRSRSMKVLLED